MANWSDFSCNMGPEMGSFLWIISLNYSQINLLISSLPVLRALLCFDEGSLVSVSHKILSRFFKILSICIFPTKNFSTKLWLPHPDLSLYLIRSTFSFNLKVFFVYCAFGVPILPLCKQCLQMRECFIFENERQTAYDVNIAK